mgnify:CR=1 FL=1
MLAIRTIPTIPAVFAGRGPRPARRLAQDSPTSPVLRKDWRPAICAVAARIPRYAIARPAVCPDCTPPAASMELGETADPPAVSAAVWAGMAAVRGASAVHGVRDSAHPDASRDAPWPAFFLDSEQSAESVCSVGTYPVGVRRAPRLMPAMRCAHIRRFFRRSQECSCAPVARCEYASSPA